MHALINVARSAVPARHFRFAAVCAVMPLLLAGCLSQLVPEPAPLPVTYDFGPLPAEPPAPLPARARLARVSAPSWLESTNIYYRRLDEEPAALHRYAQNVWIASTAELFAERLEYRLVQAAPAADAESRPLARELEVALELVSFEHVYTSAAEAYVAAQARASYEDARGAVRTQAFEQRRPAAANVAGATSVMPAVADDLLDDVIEWLRAETASLDGR